MLKKILAFFDKLEDKVRRWLSPRPLVYAFVGGIGVVLFWRGIWYTADYFLGAHFISPLLGITESKLSFWWDGPLSLAIGLAILLAVGIFTSVFIGNEIIISGIKGEKKVIEKTELELQSEAESVNEIKREIKIIASRLEKIEKSISGMNFEA
jgi:MFS superfamily sulfate permease-like transporter